MFLNRSVAALCALATSLAACSAGSVAPSEAPVLPAAHVTPADSIGGIIDTRDFIVRSNRTVTVTKDLAVFASVSVQIQGKLVVPRGVSVAFFTPTFVIVAPSGAIVAGVNPKWKGPVDDFVSACHIGVGVDTTWSVGAGDDLALTSNEKTSTDPNRPCGVTIGSGAQLALAAGAPGGSDPKRPNGQDGGSIVIGTKEAIALTQALAKKDHHAAQAFAPSVVELDAPLIAANGGDGKPDPLGGLSGGVYTFMGGNGGIGGQVRVRAGKIVGSSPNLLAGNGGNGGALAFSFAGDISDLSDYPLEGDASAPNGLPAALILGAGGGGGSVAVDAATPKNVVERPGNGGDPSVFYGVQGDGGGALVACTNCFYAGDGYDNASGGSANGGALDVVLAAPGKKGVGSKNVGSNLPTNGGYAKMTFGGGSGGVVVTPNSTIAQGGNGATLTIEPPPHVAISSLQQFGLSIVVNVFGNGSPSGPTNCPGVAPFPAGLNGGNGGDLHDNGLIDLIEIAKDVNGNSASFNGGNGASGTPPGSGGAAGIDDEGESLGRSGAAGAAC